MKSPATTSKRVKSYTQVNKASEPTSDSNDSERQIATFGTLEDDLAKYANEFYNKQDLEAGRKLLAEVIGAVAIGGVLLTILTSWLPVVGITLGSGTIVYIMMKAAEAYAELNAEDRKRVRAAVNWVKGGFDLKDKLLD